MSQQNFIVTSWDALKNFVRNSGQRAVQVRFRVKEGEAKIPAKGVLVPVTDKETYLRWVSNSLQIQDSIVEFLEGVQDSVIRESIQKTGTFSGQIDGKNLFSIVGMEAALNSGESARISKESLERFFANEIAGNLTIRILEQCPQATDTQIAKVIANYQEFFKKLASFSAKNKVSLSEKEEEDMGKLLGMVENQEGGFYEKVKERVAEMAAQRNVEADALGFVI